MKKNRKLRRDLLGGVSMSEVLEEFVGNGTDLMEKFSISEPLKTFLGNTGAIKALLNLALTNVEKKKKKADEDLKFYESVSDKASEILNESKMNLRALHKIKKFFEGGVEKARGEGDKEMEEIFEAEVKDTDELIKSIKELVAKAKKSVKESKELGRFVAVDVAGYRRQREIILPMVFVYLVSIWDAFILDTVRKILKNNPEVIKAGDAKIEISIGFIWGLESMEEVRNWLIEEVVRDLDYKRKKLVKRFKSYWGIDWKRSGVRIDDEIEIRARRDIWVHNKGVVDSQYIDMVGKNASIEEGQVAEIDGKYLDECLEKLIKLAIYTHRVAEEKHYKKADVR